MEENFIFLFTFSFPIKKSFVFLLKCQANTLCAVPILLISPPSGAGEFTCDFELYSWILLTN